MKTVHEVSELSGISIRTLHYYDKIGLLRPTQISDAGYRYYDDEALRRLQTILLFRELQFPLKEIACILDRPDFDRKAALSRQIELLELQRTRLDRIIGFARQLQITGGTEMDFSAFDRSELESYTEEAKAQWGKTDAWQEYAQKKLSPVETATLAGQMMEIFARLGALRQLPPEDVQVQTIIAELQQFITKHYYTCSNDILRGLGQMYTADERMQKNIDKAGGSGTAAFASRAIEIYCA